MAQKNKTQKLRKEITIRRRGGIVSWLYIPFSLIVPIYGVIYYIVLKQRDYQRARIALTISIFSFSIMLLLKLIQM